MSSVITEARQVEPKGRPNENRRYQGALAPEKTEPKPEKIKTEITFEGGQRAFKCSGCDLDLDAIEKSILETSGIKLSPIHSGSPERNGAKVIAYSIESTDCLVTRPMLSEVDKGYRINISCP